MYPSKKKPNLWWNMRKLRRARYGLRSRYVKLVVVLVATWAGPATVCISFWRDVRSYTISAGNMLSNAPATNMLVDINHSVLAEIVGSLSGSSLKTVVGQRM